MQASSIGLMWLGSYAEKEAETNTVPLTARRKNPPIYATEGRIRACGDAELHYFCRNNFNLENFDAKF